MYSCSFKYLVWRWTLLHVAREAFVWMVDVEERADGANETEEMADESVCEPPL